jgi:hypothetical protein
VQPLLEGLPDGGAAVLVEELGDLLEQFTLLVGDASADGRPVYTVVIRNRT